MEKWELHFHQSKKIEDVLNTATIVVDANVLLAAYQWRNVTIHEVLKVLKQLSSEKRLKIPYQVVAEFAKNRPNTIKQSILSIDQTIDSLKKDITLLKERAPMFEDSEIFKKTLENQKRYNDAYKEYKDSLVELRDEVKDLFISDNYLDELKEIVSKSIFYPENIKPIDELIEEAKKRYSKKVPPGYEDNNKDQNSAGDYIVWANILQIKDDVIFISNDTKSDWVYSDKKGNPLGARRELIEEFYNESDGRKFFHISPKAFISLYNPKISETIKNDLKQEIKSDFISNKIYGMSAEKQKVIRDDILNLLIKEDPLNMHIQGKLTSKLFYYQKADEISRIDISTNLDFLGFSKIVLEILGLDSRIDIDYSIMELISSFHDLLIIESIIIPSDTI